MERLHHGDIGLVRVQGKCNASLTDLTHKYSEQSIAMYVANLPSLSSPP